MANPREFDKDHITRTEQDTLVDKLISQINTDKFANRGSLTAHEKAQFSAEAAKYEKEGLLPTVAFHGDPASLADEVNTAINTGLNVAEHSSVAEKGSIPTTLGPGPVDSRSRIRD